MFTPVILDNDDRDEPVETETNQPENMTPETPTVPQLISLSDAAYIGLSAPQTLPATGYINGHPVTILIDCGSTHNILKPRITTLLHLSITPIPQFRVMVGNGDFIHCEGFCPSVAFQVQGASFQTPFYVLPVEGTNLVLGMARFAWSFINTLT